MANPFLLQQNPYLARALAALRPAQQMMATPQGPRLMPGGGQGGMVPQLAPDPAMNGAAPPPAPLPGPQPGPPQGGAEGITGGLLGAAGNPGLTQFANRLKDDFKGPVPAAGFPGVSGVLGGGGGMPARLGGLGAMPQAAGPPAGTPAVKHGLLGQMDFSKMLPWLRGMMA